jgi:hypothetical protein
MSTVVFLYRSIQSPEVVLSETQPSRHALLGCPTHYFIPKNALFYFPRGPGPPAPLDFTSVRDVVASVLSWKLLFGCFFSKFGFGRRTTLPRQGSARGNVRRGQSRAVFRLALFRWFSFLMWCGGYPGLLGISFYLFNLPVFFSKRIFSIRRAISVTFCVVLFIAWVILVYLQLVTCTMYYFFV